MTFLVAHCDILVTLKCGLLVICNGYLTHCSFWDMQHVLATFDTSFSLLVALQQQLCDCQVYHGYTSHKQILVIFLRFSTFAY